MNRRTILKFFPAAFAGRLWGNRTPAAALPLRTGFAEFDQLTGGLPAGSLTVVYGNREAGKTSLLLNLAEHALLKEKRPVLFFQQSFSAETLLGQLGSLVAEIDWLDFCEGKLDARDRTGFKSALQKLSALTIDDTPHLEDEELVERISRWAESHRSGVVIIDHLIRTTPRTQGRCSQAFKAVAVRTGAVVVATCWHKDIEIDHSDTEEGVGESHADFTWALYRFDPRPQILMDVRDERTGEHRLALDLELDERLRRFRVIGAGPRCESLREIRKRGLIPPHPDVPSEA
jgi:KaiC/GvpD/RAD55 family RecA-like ATPase